MGTIVMTVTNTANEENEQRQPCTRPYTYNVSSILQKACNQYNEVYNV